MQDTIIFLDFSRDEYAHVVRGIYSPRVSLLFASTLADISKLTAKAKSPYIVVAFSAVGTYQDQLSLVLEALKAGDFPVVFIGPQIQHDESRIGKVIQNSIVLNTPTDSNEVLGAIEYLRSHAKKKAQAETTPIINAPRETLHVSVPSLCFRSLSERGLRDVQMKCMPFLRATKVGSVQEWGVLPSNKKVREAVENMISNLGDAGVGHLYRTATISQRILEAMSLKNVETESTKGAALLYAWSFVKNPRLLLTDYLAPKRADKRREIAQLIESSAEKISVELGLKNEEKMVRTMAKLLGDEYQVGDDAYDIASSAIATTDMVNRICWQNGHWNPRALNHFMRHVSYAEVPDIHPVVLGLTFKILCEAVESMGARFLIEQAKCRNPQLAEVEKELAAHRDGSHEQTTPLSRLQPGMKTSRPVVSFDGREILSKNTILDEDLIWRIWQLATIRPVKPICVWSRL